MSKEIIIHVNGSLPEVPFRLDLTPSHDNPQPPRPDPSSLHRLDIVGDLEVGLGLAPHLVDVDARRQLRQREAAVLAVDLEDALFWCSHVVSPS